MKSRFLKAIAAFCTVAAALLLTGCNTIEGAGEDIEAVGSEIDEAAE